MITERIDAQGIIDFLDDMGGIVALAAWNNRELGEVMTQIAQRFPKVDQIRVNKLIRVSSGKGTLIGIIPEVRPWAEFFDMVVYTRKGPYPDLQIGFALEAQKTKIARSYLYDRS